MLLKHGSFNAGLRLDLLKFEPEAQKSIPYARLFVLTNHKLSESLEQMYYSSSLLFWIIKNDYNQNLDDKQGDIWDFTDSKRKVQQASE
jgi:hypothetical protein